MQSDNVEPLTPTCPGSVGSTRIMLTLEEDCRVYKRADRDSDKGKITHIAFYGMALKLYGAKPAQLNISCLT